MSTSEDEVKGLGQFFRWHILRSDEGIAYDIEKSNTAMISSEYNILR